MTPAEAVSEGKGCRGAVIGNTTPGTGLTCPRITVVSEIRIKTYLMRSVHIGSFVSARDHELNSGSDPKTVQDKGLTPDSNRVGAQNALVIDRVADDTKRRRHDEQIC